MKSHNKKIVISIMRRSGTEDLPLPQYMTSEAAGVDLYAAVKEPVLLKPGERALIPTGLTMAIPSGYEGQVRPRSGLALRSGVTVLNSPGTIDSDYRGEVQIILVNLGQESFKVNRGDRVAQMVIAPVTQVAWEEVKEIDCTGRAQGGFGHTGS